MNSNFNFEDESGNKTQIPTIKLSRKLIFLFSTILLAFHLVINTPILNPKFTQAQILYLVILIVLIYVITNNYKLVASIATFGFMIIFGLIIYSIPLFHSDSYYKLLGDVETVNYYEDVPNIDNTKLPVVDEDLANKLGDKVLGEDVGLGSQYSIGKYYLISENENLAWVAPLEPRGFFKWLQNLEGSPGYVYVSATDPNDVRLVKNIEGDDINIKYSENAYLLNDIKRHAYLAGNLFRGMTDYSFEIDDNGLPYWVITTYAPSIGVAGYDTTGVILIDSQTGDSTYYTDIEKVPDWVERIQPNWIIESQTNSWGTYKNGWLNTILGQKEMITSTPGSSYVYIDGNPFYYTGLTSITNDESTVGFILVDLRDKSSKFYQLTGATETAAIDSAQGQVQQFGYHASFPILVNEYNTATYFMTLKDNDGLLKQYAFVSVENYNIVGVGSSIDEARSNYYSVLKENNKIDNSKSETESLSGTIERITLVGATYYFKLKDSDVLYTVESDINPILPITQVGDSVSIKFINSQDTYMYVTEIVNNTLEKQ